MKPLPLPANSRRSQILLVTAGMGIVLAVGLQPWYHTSDEAHSILITVFTVLAGFLLTAITLSADVARDRGDNWRAAYFHARLARAELRLHLAMLCLYLVIIALAFVDALHLPISAPGEVWLERAILFLSVIAFLGSIKLPVDLVRGQMDRLDRHVGDRRQQETHGRNPHDLKRHAA